MFLMRSLRAKVILAALIPSSLALLAVALVALTVYEQIARDVVQQRDTELARVSAERLSEGLAQHVRNLRNTAGEADIRAMEPSRLRIGLEAALSQLFVFDAGVVVYDNQGVAIAAEPKDAERLNTVFLVPAEFDKVRDTRQTSVSDMFVDPVSGENVFLIAVPIVGSGTEFKGVLAGLASINRSRLGAMYVQVLEFKPGKKGFAYLVDGNGLVIHHRQTAQLGRSLAGTEPVDRVIGGGEGAVITEDAKGDAVISGFSPVPGTSWGIITQERWSNVVGPLRNYGLLLLVLLVVGGAVAAVTMFFFIGRSLKPVQLLTQGAQRIADGEFEHTIEARTGDEIQTLARQFNTMAGTLKESYADLEQKVADRTEELGRSEERYRRLFEESRDAIFVSEQGVVVAANQAALGLFAFTLEEAIGSDVADRYANPDDRERFREQIELTGSVRDFEVKLLKHDGTVMDCLLTATRHLSEDGDHGGALQCLVRDVTERKKAEQALRETEERFRRLVEDAADGFFVMTPDGKIVDVNQMASQQFGFSRDELVELSATDVYVTCGDTEPADMYQLTRPEEPITLEGEGRRKDGSTFPVEVRLDRIELAGLQHMFALVRDITERKEAENTQVQQMRELAVLEERNRMAREIHDTLAQGFTGIVLQLEAADQALEGPAAEVADHLVRAKGLARESLQEARRSVWGLVPHALEHDTLEEALRKRVEQVNASGPARASFRLSGPPRVLPADAQAAVLRICQESLTNATRHANAGDVAVDLSFDSTEVRLRVQDDGRGFDIDEVKANHKNRGFGLLGMEQRVRLLGGTFSIKSQKGHGTTVEVQVPV